MWRSAAACRWLGAHRSGPNRRFLTKGDARQTDELSRDPPLDPRFRLAAASAATALAYAAYRGSHVFRGRDREGTSSERFAPRRGPGPERHRGGVAATTGWGHSSGASLDQRTRLSRGLA
jgi:hypothetical protein